MNTNQHNVCFASVQAAQVTLYTRFAAHTGKTCVATFDVLKAAYANPLFALDMRTIRTSDYHGVLVRYLDARRPTPKATA